MAQEEEEEDGLDEWKKKIVQEGERREEKCLIVDDAVGDVVNRMTILRGSFYCIFITLRFCRRLLCEVITAVGNSRRIRRKEA